MRDPDRIDPMIELLRAVWKENPDWRLGQVVANAVRSSTGVVKCDPFNVHDDDMKKGLEYLRG